MYLKTYTEYKLVVVLQYILYNEGPPIHLAVFFPSVLILTPPPSLLPTF